MVIKNFQDFHHNELYAIFRHIYLTSSFMSDDFDLIFNNSVSFKNYYQQILDRPGSFVLIALIDEKPAGYLLLEPNPAMHLKHTALLNMGIIDIFRRQGIGVKLVEAAFERARAEKIIEIIYLMVRSDNFAALQLYKKTGFETLTYLENDTKVGNEYFDGVVMRKFL